MASKFDLVADDLRRRIDERAFLPGSRLPAETSLLADYGVSLGTLRKALDLLAAEGRIDRQQGRGTFVADPRTRLRRDSRRYQWEQDRITMPNADRELEGATEKDSGAERDDLDFTATYSQVPADPDLAAAFGTSIGEPLLRRTYATRLVAAAPFGYTISHLRVKDLEANPALLDETNEPWPGGTQHQLSTVGIIIRDITDHVTARAASALESRILGVRPGAPVIALRKVSTSTTDHVVEVADNVWPGDRIELTYRTTLRGTLA